MLRKLVAGSFLVIVGFALGLGLHDTIRPPAPPKPHLNDAKTQAIVYKLLNRKDVSISAWVYYADEEENIIVKSNWVVCCEEVPHFQKVNEDRAAKWSRPDPRILGTKSGLHVWVKGCGKKGYKDGTIVKIWLAGSLLGAINSTQSIRESLARHGIVFWINQKLADKYEIRQELQEQSISS